MTVQERLEEEFKAAIYAIYGDLHDEDDEEFEFTREDILAIAKKVIFYLGI